MEILIALAQFFANNVLWISMIVLFPLWVRLGKILGFLIGSKLFPTRSITVRYIKNGELIGEKKILLDANEPVIQQIQAVKAAGSEHE